MGEDVRHPEKISRQAVPKEETGCGVFTTPTPFFYGRYEKHGVLTPKAGNGLLNNPTRHARAGGAGGLTDEVVFFGVNDDALADDGVFTFQC